MDGGRRLLRPVKRQDEAEEARALAVRARRRRGAAAFALDLIRAPRHGTGLFLTLALAACVGLFGAARGGQYEAFTAEQGGLKDFLARGAGFDIAAVTISGQSSLREAEVLAIAGISPKSSLVFLDAADVRRRLMASPFVREASVRKLFPDRLVIEITEREAFALWQKDGRVNVIARDGVVIDEMRDDRFASLPFVVGEEANTRIGEYLALLGDAGDLREKVRAGMLVAGRRWNLKMSAGMDIKLPETNPAAALQTLARLDRETHILDKDVLSLDLREPGRIIAKLSEEGVLARAEAQARRTTRTKGSQT